MITATNQADLDVERKIYEIFFGDVHYFDNSDTPLLDVINQEFKSND